MINFDDVTKEKFIIQIGHKILIIYIENIYNYRLRIRKNFQPDIEKTIYIIKVLIEILILLSTFN